LVSRRRINTVTDVRSMRGTNCDSDALTTKGKFKKGVRRE
jgi:hypothetical protein